ncbi:MAG: citrate lyase ACP [Acidobacteria bacterium]|nr:citrate lyase ACP [Acidobacteriota bacterium]
MSRRGEAGRRGEDIRSDLHVAVEARGGGGIEIDLKSRVAPYYCESIRTQVRQVLGDLGVTSARVEVDDKGALPFVIAARLEAALRRAGATGREAPPQRLGPLPSPSTRDRMRRSRLYLPGTEPKFFVNAGLHGPDAVILDLEDSVHPDEKDAARLLVRNALLCCDFQEAERTVRINPGDLGREDLRAVVPALPDLILLPKVEDPEEVRAVDAEVGSILKRLGKDRPLWLMPILETALGIERAYEVARASPRVVALTIGLEDYTADLGTAKTEEGAESLYARTRLVNAARAAGVQAIDSVYGDFEDLDGLRRWAEASRRLGFEGMGCVHPRQIPVIHAAFNPSPAEIEKAQRIVAAYREAQEKGLGVVSLGSKMIDPPVVERAKRVVERARRLVLLPPGGAGKE